MKKRYSIMLIIVMLLIMLMSMGASVFADETDGSFSYDGDAVTFIKEDGSAFGMWAPQEGTTIVRKNGQVYISIVPKNTTTYKGMHWGKITDTDLTIDVSLTGGRLTMVVNEDMCGYAYPIVAVKPDGSGTTTTQYYLAIPARNKITEIPTENLAITNNTKMFRAVSAYIENLGGNTNLVVALSSDGYNNLYKGTYEAAINNGLNKDNWIRGYKNAAGKWEFSIPLSENETRVPVVSISQSHLEEVEAGKETIEQCMFYRLLEVDYDAKTLTTGDYYEINDIAVTNAEMFYVNGTATLRTTGATSSNNYSNKLTLTMGSRNYDKVQADTYDNYGGQMKTGDPIVIDLGEGNVFSDIPVKNGSQVLRFHSAAEDKWYYGKLTMDLDNKTAAFAALTEEEKAAEELKDAKRDAQGAVADAEAVDTSVYSKENADAIAAALQALKDLIASDTTTAEEVNSAKKKLEDAIKKAKNDKKAADEQAEKEKAAKEEAARKKAAIAKVQKAKVGGLKVKAGKKKVTVTWKKNKAFAGYKIKYKVGNKTKTLTIKKAATVKKVLKKLKKGKVVKVQIRGYKKLYGKMYYGKWSAMKKAKVK